MVLAILRTILSLGNRQESYRTIKVLIRKNISAPHRRVRPWRSRWRSLSKSWVRTLKKE